MKLSASRREKVWNAVLDEILKLRLELNKDNLVSGIVERMVAQAGEAAARAAIRAFEGEAKK